MERSFQSRGKVIPCTGSSSVLASARVRSLGFFGISFMLPTVDSEDGLRLGGGSWFIFVTSDGEEVKNPVTLLVIKVKPTGMGFSIDSHLEIGNNTFVIAEHGTKDFLIELFFEEFEPVIRKGNLIYGGLHVR
jgi:hypothetical protein